MNYLQECHESLNWLSSVSFRFRPKSEDVVQKGLLLANAFEKLSLDEKNKIIESLAPNLDMKLFSLSGWMAEAAINEENEILVRGALILHLLENFRLDYRENIRYLILIAFAANELGFEFAAIADPLMYMASPQAKQYLSEFSNRDIGLNKLSSFGIKGEKIDGIFRFSRL